MEAEPNLIADLGLTKTNAALDLETLYQFSLNHRILPNCALSAVVEPQTTETLVAVSTSNKIILKNQESSLNIADKIRCISTFASGDGYDFIVAGTESQLIVFDFYNNTTVFQKDVPDGVNCIVVGKLADREPLILCGGNCAIWGFDVKGADKYWTVTGDAVTDMCLCDYDNDGELELIIGSPDFEIRIFKDDLMRAELMETDAVTCLQSILKGCFLYALANGTLGLYKGCTRIWRIKSKHQISALLDFPAHEDLFTCVWDAGKIDIRSIDKSDSIFSMHATEGGSLPVVAAFSSKISNSEYLSSDPQKASQFTLVSSDGRVFGYSTKTKEEVADKTHETLRDFGQKKHNLLMELSNFEIEEQMSEAEKEKEYRIPASTKVAERFFYNLEERMLHLEINASHEVCIRCVVAFAEGMFEGDSYIWIPQSFEGNGDVLTVPLLPQRDSESDLSIRILLGRMDGDKMFIYDHLQTVPRFSRFAIVKTDSKHYVQPKSFVELKTKTRISKIQDWLLSHFIIAPEDFINEENETEELEVKFIEVAPKKELSLYIKYSVSSEQLIVAVDSLETAAALIQSMGSFLSWEDMESTATFPAVFQEIERICSEMDALWEIRDRLAAELMEKQQVVKEIVVRAEDSLNIADYDSAVKYYARMRNNDRAVRQAYLLKSSNNDRFVNDIRLLNKMIEHGSKLRYGKPSRAIVTACRTAINEDNKDIIVKILQYGAQEE